MLPQKINVPFPKGKYGILKIASKTVAKNINVPFPKEKYEGILKITSKTVAKNINVPFPKGQIRQFENYKQNSFLKHKFSIPEGKKYGILKIDKQNCCLKHKFSIPEGKNTAF